MHKIVTIASPFKFTFPARSDWEVSEAEVPNTKFQTESYNSNKILLSLFFDNQLKIRIKVCQI
jgi:hypothetical protein